MSLTSHIDDPNSAVRRHFAERYSHVRNLRYVNTTGGQNRDRETQFVAGDLIVCPDLTGDYYNAGSAGTAFDYRVRYMFEPRAPEELVAASGARLLATATRGPGGRLDAWEELAAALPRGRRPAAQVPEGAGLAGYAPSPEDLHLARLCGVVAFYEQLYRCGVGSPGWIHSPVVAAGANARLEDLLALVDDRLPVDVSAMAALLAASQPQLLAASDVIANPWFACSGALGGADADLVLDGLLVDLKTSRKAGVLSQTWWQVLGYLLADTPDRHHISRVGVYYARFGTLWSYPVPEFLGRLAGTEVDLSQARLEFADVVAGLHPRRGS